MHEWALAEAVVASASEIADKKHLKKIAEVRIKVGGLQQIDDEIFQFALDQLRTAKLKKAKFTIETAGAILKCRICNNKWSFDRDKLDLVMAEAIHFVPEVAHAYIKCPKCGSPDFEAIEGRGIWLESIRGVK